MRDKSRANLDPISRLFFLPCSSRTYLPGECCYPTHLWSFPWWLIEEHSPTPISADKSLPLPTWRHVSARGYSGIKARDSPPQSPSAQLALSQRYSGTNIWWRWGQLAPTLGKSPNPALPPAVRNSLFSHLRSHLLSFMVLNCRWEKCMKLRKMERG